MKYEVKGKNYGIRNNNLQFIKTYQFHCPA